MESPDKASVPTGQYYQIERAIEERVGFELVEDAEEMFVIAKERMLYINDWNQLVQSADVSFLLLDANGHQASRHAHAGDFIRISAEKDSDGRNEALIKIESIVYDDFPDDNRERIGMKLISGDESATFSSSYYEVFFIERIYTDVFARFEIRDNAQDFKDGGLLSKLPGQVIQSILNGWLNVDNI